MELASTSAVVGSRLDQKKLDELKSLHQGESIHVLTAADEVLVVVSPRRQVYAVFREMITSGRNAEANEALVNLCAIWPTRNTPELEAIFDRHPAVIDTFANALVKLAGGGVPAEAKKL